jgi:serine protease Do
VRKILEDGDVQSLLRLHPGDSGGPLINPQGELIGVNRAIWQSRYGENTGISFATNLFAAQTLIEQNRAAAESMRPTIAALPPNDPFPTGPLESLSNGADFPPTAPDFAPPDLDQRRESAPSSDVRLGVLLDSRSLVIKTVQPGSPAAQAGLNPGDRLLAINGTMLSSMEDLVAFLEQRPASMVVTIDRQQQQSDVRINF